ncbi:MAG: hypothetical protein CSMARM5_0095 [Candidatus Parvarchaeum acidophilus ARMAN-5_'5-way FS']|jgi:hypothetical protein|uniref:Uncharacterized protein n=2 Tax=Parvarchaeum acidophilus TaxID=662761 RepID=D6GW98_PARA5|nr:MAG: hypothetical protein BJBARM5_0780 [Candidatus Parvarchaeum acidophilus ARMAN-5]EGD71948.1 MAG: hypothetical protein CSMARM5_0095 [Candidatus Parvarchaeum acidophilus ARMAN-5_'5-way FS']
MEKTEEMNSLYEKLLEQITLYNQFKNNVSFEKAQKLSELLVKINNLAVKVGISHGDVEAQLMEMEMQLQSIDKNRSIIFI